MSSFNGFILPKPDKGRGGGLWMNDWSAYQTVYDYSASTVSQAANITRTIVDVTGEGYVLFIRPFSTTFQAELPPLILTIDGLTYNFDGASVSSSVFAQQGNLVAHPIYFRNQLRIHVRNKHTSSAQIGCDYLYLLKSSEPDPNKQTYLQSGSRLSAFAVATSTPYSTVASVSGSGYILSIFGEAYYGTAAGSHLGALTIDGQSKYAGRTMATSHNGQRSGLLLGPIRFSSSFQVQHQIDSGSTAFTRVMYTLD